VAFAAFEALSRRHHGLDLYRLLRMRAPERMLPESDLLAAVARLQAALGERATAGAVRLGGRVQHGDPEDVVADALRHFGIYHDRPALRREGDQLNADDLNLLLYYRNRLTGYGLEEGYQ
jgi:glycerol-3-phosphate O-acyltransferase